MDLFDTAGATADGVPAAGPGAPLAVRMRPRTLDEVAGQAHLLEQGSPLRRHVAPGGESSRRAGPASVILWGPPGTGKTTLLKVAKAALEAQGRQLIAVAPTIATGTAA